MGVMRFLFAVAVVLAHITDTFGFDFPKVLKLIPGGLAVELFFAISGFYMALILTDKYADAPTFYLNRFLRLYPVFLVVTLLTCGWFVLTWVYVGGTPQGSVIRFYGEMRSWQALLLILSNWTMFGQDIPSLFHFRDDIGFAFFFAPQPIDASGAKWVGEFRTIPQAWSIGVEIWFYMLAPVLARSRTALLLGLATLSVAIKAWMAHAGLMTYFFFPAQLCFFIAGMLMHRVYAKFPSPRWSVSAVIMATTIAFFIIFPTLPQSYSSYVAYAVFIPAMPALFSLTRKSDIDATIGNLSYPIYIVHALVLTAGTIVLRHSSISLSGPMVTALILSVVAAAAILCRFVERPIENTRRVIANRAIEQSYPRMASATPAHS